MPREKEDFRDLLEMIYRRYPEGETLNMEETAQILNVHKDTVRKNKKLPFKKLGRRRIITKVALARYMS